MNNWPFPVVYGSIPDADPLAKVQVEEPVACPIEVEDALW